MEKKEELIKQHQKKVIGNKETFVHSKEKMLTLIVLVFCFLFISS